MGRAVTKVGGARISFRIFWKTYKVKEVAEN